LISYKALDYAIKTTSLAAFIDIFSSVLKPAMA